MEMTAVQSRFELNFSILSKHTCGEAPRQQQHCGVVEYTGWFDTSGVLGKLSIFPMKIYTEIISKFAFPSSVITRHAWLHLEATSLPQKETSANNHSPASAGGKSTGGASFSSHYQTVLEKFIDATRVNRRDEKQANNMWVETCI